MSNSKKLLIFGVSGFVGHYLSEEFYNNGYEVAGCDIVKSGSVPDYVHFEICDVLDSDSVKKCIESVLPDYIINLAAISSVGQSWKIPQKTIAVNVEGSINILEAVGTINPSVKMLFIGSSEEYAASDTKLSENSLLDGSSPYGISKVMQEKFADIYRKKYRLDIRYARAFNHTGIGQSERFVIPSWCKQAARISVSGTDGVIRVGNTNLKRDFLSVMDVVSAYRLIIESDKANAVYNVGSGNAYLLKDILNIIISFSSQRIEVVQDVNMLRPSDNSYICCDNSLIYTELGWKPKYSINEILKSVFDYFVVNQG